MGDDTSLWSWCESRLGEGHTKPRCACSTAGSGARPAPRIQFLLATPPIRWHLAETGRSLVPPRSHLSNLQQGAPGQDMSSSSCTDLPGCQLRCPFRWTCRDQWPPAATFIPRYDLACHGCYCCGDCGYGYCHYRLLFLVNMVTVITIIIAATTTITTIATTATTTITTTITTTVTTPGAARALEPGAWV